MITKHSLFQAIPQGGMVGFAVLLVAVMCSLSGCLNLKNRFQPPVEEPAPVVVDPDALPNVTTQTTSVGWSWYTKLRSNRDFDAVGIIIIRDVKSPTVELMSKAKEMGADEVINIRIDFEKDRRGNIVLLAASGIAVKYQDTPYYGRARVGVRLFDSGAVNDWSKYVSIPDKDYTPVSVVVVANETKTPAADLMEQASAVGADDIINVLIDLDTKKEKIIGASALAIKYKDLPLYEHIGDEYLDER